MNKAVFLDRDGTINIEKNYLYKVADFEFIPGAIEAIRTFNQLGFKVIVVTNQSGVARGYYSEKKVEILHNWMAKEIENQGAIIDDIFYCPHHSEHGIGKYKIDCECRKPKSGMLLEAIKKHNIDPYISYIIGDKATDLDAGKRIGTHTILVSTGYGKYTNSLLADYKFENLIQAAKSLMDDDSCKI